MRHGVVAGVAEVTTTTDAVIAELRRRHDKGLETYGVPLEQSALDRRQMLQMAKENRLYE